jgi:hypothetical protein
MMKGCVQIDHQRILRNERVPIIAVLAPSFEQLMVGTIGEANHARLDFLRLFSSHSFHE